MTPREIVDVKLKPGSPIFSAKIYEFDGGKHSNVTHLCVGQDELVLHYEGLESQKVGSYNLGDIKSITVVDRMVKGHDGSPKQREIDSKNVFYLKAKIKTKKGETEEVLIDRLSLIKGKPEGTEKSVSVWELCNIKEIDIEAEPRGFVTEEAKTVEKTKAFNEAIAADNKKTPDNNQKKSLLSRLFGN